MVGRKSNTDEAGPDSVYVRAMDIIIPKVYASIARAERRALPHGGNKALIDQGLFSW